MSSASAHGFAPGEKDPLLRLAQALPEAQQRESYAALVAYIHSLQPSDELAKVAQLFGFLTLMGYRLPEVLADQQTELRALLENAQAEFKKQVQTNSSYHDKLNERLSQLPGEIAASVKPEVIAKTMSESFRQQILKTGLQETQALLAGSVQGLNKTTQALDQAIEPLTRRYNDLAYAVETRAANLDLQSNNLARTADTIQRKNAELVDQAGQMNWVWVATVGIVILLVGVFGGMTWEQRNVASLVIDLQNQIGQLQQDLKAPAPVSTEPATKHLKKK